MWSFWSTLSALVICSQLTFGNGENVLLMQGFPSPSHSLWMRAISNELVRRGHNVTFLGANVEANSPPNLHYIRLEKVYEGFENADFDIFEFAKMGPWAQFLMGMVFFEGFDASSRASDGFQTLMNYPEEFKFDLIIYDYLESPGLLVFADRFPSASLIGASAYPLIYFTNPMTGAPYFPSFVPNHNVNQMENTFCDRLLGFMLNVADVIYEKCFFVPKIEKDLRKTYPKMKPLRQLIRQTKIQLVNYSPALDFIQPMMPSVIPVGGLQISQPKPLPAELEKIFQNSNKGVVLFSLGTNVKSEVLGQKRLTEVVEALRQIPDYTFLWKLDDTGLELDLPKNVIIRKWLPQNDILGHKKTVLFMSHGGGLSTQECTWFGIPMLGMPVFFDQFANVAKAQKLGMALKVELTAFDRDTLRDTILEMLNNKKYSEKAKLRSRNFRDQPETPMERAMWWIEYVMRNPDLSFLKSPILDMGYMAKHSIDIIVFLTLVTIILFYIFYKIFKVLIRTFVAKASKVTKQKRN